MRIFPRWLLAALVLAMLVLVGGGVWFYRIQEQLAQQQAEKDLLAIAKLKTAQIVNWRAERLGDAGVIMRSPFFIKAAVQWLADPHSVDVEQILTRFRSLRDNYHYRDVLLADATGQVHLSLSNYSGRLHAQTMQALAVAFQKRRPVLSELHVGPNDRSPHINAIAPLFAGAGRTGAPAGAVLLKSDARQFLYPMIQAWPTTRQSAETLLVRREGKLVLFLNELRYQPGTALKWRVPLSDADLPAAMAILGQEGIVQGKDYRGENVLAALSKIPGSPWFMVAKVDKSEAMAEWRSRSILILVLILGFVGGIGAVFLVVWQRNAKAHYREMYQAEVNRREVEQRYRATLMSVGDGVIATDAEGKMEIMNPVAEVLTGWTQEEAHGRPLKEVFQIVSEDTRQLVENPVDQVVKEGLVVGLANHTLLIAKDGTQRPIADSGAPVYNEQGDIVGVVLVFRDQTAERAAQKALQDSEERYRGILDNMMEGFQIIDQDWRYIYINDTAAAHGRQKKKELLGRTMMEVYPGIEKTEMFMAVRRCMDEGAPARMLNEFAHADGSTSWFELSIQCIPEGVSILSLDITERKRAEESLKASQARQNVAMDLAKLVQWEYDVDSDLFTFDEQFYQLYGTTTEEQGGTQMSAQEYARRFVPPEQASRVKEEIDKSLATTDPKYSRQIEHRIVRTDGRERNIIVRLAIVKDKDGRTIKIYGANQDITELKRAQKSLEESERTLRAVFEGVMDGILVVNAETKKFIFANQAICRMLGYNLEEILSLGLADIHPQEDLPRVAEQFERQLRGEISLAADVPVRRKDGTIFSADINAKPIVLEGQPCVIGLFRDITPRKMAGKALRESEERYRVAFDLAPIGVAHVDTTEGKYLLVNQRLCEILGYSAEELRGMTAFEVTHPDDREEAGLLHDKIKSGEKPKYSREKRYLRKDGSVVWAHTTVSPVRETEGQIKHIIIVVEDITERKQTEEEKARLEGQLVRSQRLEAIGTLAGGIAHDFNNILSAQLGYTQLALEDAQGQPQLEESLNRALQASRRATSLVKQILSFSRQTDPKHRPIRVHLVVKEALELLRASIPTSIDIAHNLEVSSQTILGDSGQIHQVIMNLCTNAAHAMRERGGTLEVRLNSVALDENALVGLEGIKPGEYQRLTVQDNGHGMDRETLDRIFDPFFTTKDKGEGTGLGLSVVYGIVKNHGGTIRVYSEMGKGTVFNVYFPIVESQEEEPEDIYSEGQLPTGTEHILLVDDEEMLVDVVGQILERLGYEVMGCTSSAKALDLLKRTPGKYDMLTTDFTMPRMAGDVLAERALALKPGLPVIMCTGYSEKIDKQKARQIGIGRLLMKPVEERELAGTVRSLLDKARGKTDQQEDPDIDLTKEKITMLLVDDELAIFDSLRRALRSTKIDLIYAGSGEKAVETYQDRGAEIDIVLTDLGMPGMGGEKAAEKILEMDPQATILIMSGYGNRDGSLVSLHKRIAGFLDKPFSSKELIQVIKKVMARKAKLPGPEKDPV